MGRDILKLGLKNFLIIFLFGCIIFLYINHTAYNSEMSKIKSREIRDLSSHNSFVVGVINTIASDVLLLSRLPDLREYIKSEHVENTLFEFSRTKQIYDQIRYINIDGYERSRINWNNGNPIIINKKNLQNKIGRYYFEDTIKLSNGQIFISPLDLNIELGEIEKPLKPMLRIGTPLYDFKNNKKGIVLLNYFGLDLINNLRDKIKSEYSSLYFLNQNGYWLYSDQKTDEWGFMYPEKQNMTFQNKFSEELWNEINNNNSGQMHNSLGIFTYNTVYPLMTSNYTTSASGDTLESGEHWKNYKWKLITYIPSLKLKTINRGIINNNSTMIIFFFLFSILISYILSRSIILKKVANVQKLTAEKRYHVLFEKAGESIVVTASDRTLMTNERSVDLFEYDQEEFLSMPIEALFHSDDREMITKIQTDLFNCLEEHQIVEARAITKSGKQKWVEIRPTMLEFNNNKALLYFFLDITQRRIMESELEKLATIDSLTQCYNRRFFTEALEKEINRSLRLNLDLSLIMMDIDFFKKINDTYGHDVGDVVLTKFIEITNIEVRDIDIIGRLGGEEFAIILPNCSENNGFLCAERIRTAIEDHKFIINGVNDSIGFTVSLGITQIRKADTVERALKRVDNALYSAKNDGRNKTILV